MVKLGFRLQTKGSLEKVFDYFSRFEKISEWDLNVQSSKIIKQTPNKIGSTYQVISLWKGKPSQMVYQMVDYQPNKSVFLKAQNGMIEATDLLQFHENKEGTEIVYSADISLRHVLWLLTPLIKGDLEELAVRAEKGMRDKCTQLWG